MLPILLSACFDAATTLNGNCNYSKDGKLSSSADERNGVIHCSLILINTLTQRAVDRPQHETDGITRRVVNM